MTVDFRLLLKLSLGISILSIIVTSVGPQLNADPPPQKALATAHSVKLVIKTDKERYSPQDAIDLTVALRNDGDSPIYVDRRMFWGYMGGLLLEIRDQRDKQVAPQMRDDATMPPSLEGDTTILNRIDPAFFYGRRRKLHITDYFKGPGTYTIRVRYKSWLRKEEVETQLRNLPAIWADAPPIDSDSVSIVINP